MSNTPDDNLDEIVLNNIRAMSERKIRTKIIIPLLTKIGATNIDDCHGTQERGKDITYTIKDTFGDFSLEVCQVKNAPFTSQSSSPNDLFAVLNQLQKCKKLTIFNPILGVKEQPNSVVLWCTYPIPNRCTADAEDFLKELRAQNVKCIGPDKFISLLKEHMSNSYQEIAFPGKKMSLAMLDYLNSHHEAIAFDIVQTKGLAEFFVNLGVECDLDWNKNTSTKNIKTKSIYIEKETCEYFRSIQDTLGGELSRFSLLKTEETMVDGKLKLKVTELNFQKYVELYTQAIKRLSSLDYQENSGVILPFIQRNAVLVRFIIHHFYDRDVFQKNKKWKDTLPRFFIQQATPEAFLYSEGNYCIVGDAGAGKTSLARMISQKALKNGYKCVYLPCTEIRSSSDKIITVIERFVNRIAKQNKKEYATYYKSPDLIVLDGCDEAKTFGNSLSKEINKIAFKGTVKKRIKIPENKELKIPDDLQGIVEYDHKSQFLNINKKISVLDFERLQNANSNKAVLKGMSDLWTLYKRKNPRVIITTRTIDGLLPLDGFSKVSLLPFDDEQLKTFYRIWFHDDLQSCKEILSFLDNNPYIKELARTPMLATLIAALHKNGYNLPRSKTEIYSQRFDLLIRKWDSAKKISRNRFRHKDKMILLRRLALLLHSEHRRKFKKRDLRAIWNAGFKEEYKDNNLDDLIWELHIVNNVITSSGNREYSLGHLSHQEYLVAEAIMHNQMQEILLNNLSSTWWRGVLIFFAGVCGDISSFLEMVQTVKTVEMQDGLIQEMCKESRFTSPATLDFLYESSLDSIGLSKEEFIAYKIGEQILQTPKGDCPNCGGGWDIEQGGTCHSCRSVLGIDFKIIQTEGDAICPMCGDNALTPVSDHCANCKHIIIQNWFEWNPDF